LTVLSGGLAIGVTAALWTAALGGVLTKLRYPLRFERLSIVVYLLFGWQGLFLVPPLFAALPEPAAVLIVTGGVLYSVGTAFHIWTRLPFQNAIWHGFVVLAAGCHYAAIGKPSCWWAPDLNLPLPCSASRITASCLQSHFS
jgi:hemolysin III